MQLAGTTSWRIAVDEPQSLLIALFVRDASNLRPHIESGIPPLEPPVPGKAYSGNAIASEQWGEWWRQLLEGGGFWPDDKHASDLPRLTHDPEIQRLFYWPSQNLPPNFDGLSGTPELQHLVRTHFEEARAWTDARQLEFGALSSARQRRLLEGEVVGIVQRGLRRRARPFTFDVRVLPVAGARSWRLSSERALITRALFRDPVAYREWLRPIVEELA
jgi:hypothetical protein